MLPEIIANGTVIADDVPNKYNVSDINKRYAYIEHICTVGGEEVVIKIDIKKSPQKNKFWVHRVWEKENVSNFPASTKNGTEAGYTKADISKIVSHPEGNVKELFSEKGESVYDTMGETERVKKENEKLRADVERLKERIKLERTVTHGNILNNNQLLNVAGHLRYISHSQIDKVELANKLKDLYSFIGQSENLTWEEVYRRSYVIADAMLNESKPQTETNDYYKEILWDIKNSRVRLSDSQKQEASHIFGSHWNRQFFGKTIISNEGISLEAQWVEWAEKYPGIFDADISEADMITELYNIVTSIKEASEIILDYDAEENRRWLANEIYNQYWNVSSVKTMADRHEKRVKQLNFEHRKASDVTYFKFKKNAYYICVIIDLFSRMVVGYKIGKRNSSQLVKTTLQNAYNERQPTSSLVLHTNRGANYRAEAVNKYIKSLNIIHSFSRVGKPHDNSVIESFFASMKREELYRTKYRSEIDFRNAVDRYIIFYNTKIPHTKLKYKTLQQKEAEYALENAGLKERDK